MASATICANHVYSTTILPVEFGDLIMPQLGLVNLRCYKFYTAL